MPKLIIAERFSAEADGLSAIVLPLDVVSQHPDPVVDIWILTEDLSDLRHARVCMAPLRDDTDIMLSFRGFPVAKGRCFSLIVAGGDPGPAESVRTPDLGWVRAQAGRIAERPLCVLASFCDDRELRYQAPRLVKPEREIMLLRWSGARAQQEIRVHHFLDRFWCDRYGMYFEGWVHAYEKKVRRLIISVGEDSCEVSEFSARPDVAALFPEHPHVVECGFAVYVASRPGEPASFTVVTDAGEKTIPLEFPKLDLPEAPRSPLELEAFRNFAAEVNERRGVVLEIGARLVSPEAEDYRQYFSGASRFIGIDVHPSETVDVVGDAHFLSSLVGEHSVDAVFSASVLEHMSHPWLLAIEVNRVLRPNGLVFHAAPHSFPVHELPNDFWRFSDEGLKVLFGPSSGFEVIDAGMRNAVDMYSQVRRGVHLMYPLNPGYAVAYILGRKVRDLERTPSAWRLDAAASSELASRYPRHD